MNMFKPVGAGSVDEYFAMLNEERREQLGVIDDLIRSTVPNLQRYFASNMIGYGKFKYTDYKKREADWPIIALASQKNYISLYVCAIADGEYLAEKYQDDLGKVSVGKSCIRFKKLDDVNLEALKKVIKLAEKTPGLIAAGQHK